MGTRRGTTERLLAVDAERDGEHSRVQRTPIAESRALQTFADAASGRSALPLLGAPLLAVVATFVFQPKASGSHQDAAFVSEPASETATLADDARSEPWTAVEQALDIGRFDVARSLLAHSPERASSARWQAYSLMLECLERPSDGASAAARRLYLAGAPTDVRRDLFRVCLNGR